MAVHGITVNESTTGTNRVEISDSVIALIGTAPLRQNTPGVSDILDLTRNSKTDALFGVEIPGYTIPSVLRVIREQAPTAKVIVINITRAAHYIPNPSQAFAGVSIPVAGGAAQLDSGTGYSYDADPANVVLTNLAVTVTYVKDTHYSIDATGAITVIDAIAIPDATNILATWASPNQATVTSLVALPDYAPQAGTLVVKSQDGSTTYTEGNDYSVNEWGEIIALTGAMSGITEGDTLSLEYSRLDATTVIGADISGTYLPGNATGIKALDDSLSILGYVPNIMIVPTYNGTSGVWQAMEAWADQYQGISLVDGTAGITPAAAVLERAVTASKPFNTANANVLCCYPMMKISDNKYGGDILMGLSNFVAGIIAQQDTKQAGYQYSPSNVNIKGLSGAERVISWHPSGAGTDTATLNDAGIITVKQAGSSQAVWGLTNASFPTVSDGTHFINPRRTYNEAKKAIEGNTVQFLGKPLTTGLRDAVVQNIKNFLNSEIQKGSLLPGSDCTYDPAKNTPAELAAGELELDVTVVAPSPAGNIIMNFVIDPSLYVL